MMIFPFPKVWYVSSQGVYLNTVFGVSSLGDVLKFASFVCKLLEQATMVSHPFRFFFTSMFFNIHNNICWIWQNLRFTTKKSRIFFAFVSDQVKAYAKCGLISFIVSWMFFFPWKRVYQVVSSGWFPQPSWENMLIKIGNHHFPNWVKKKHPKFNRKIFSSCRRRGEEFCIKSVPECSALGLGVWGWWRGGMLRDRRRRKHRNL